jgi:allene oxide cyclase-like protein
MQKYWLVPVLVVALAAVWAWTASATDGPRTLTLIEVSLPKNDRPLGDFTFDRPPMGGDQFIVRNALFQNGRRVGRVEVLHTFITGFGSTFSRKARMLFLAQLYVRGGTILVEGYEQVAADGPAKLTFPIVGGTGRYADVRGSINVRTLSENKTRLDLALVP